MAIQKPGRRTPIITPAFGTKSSSCSMSMWQQSHALLPLPHSQLENVPQTTGQFGDESFQHRRKQTCRLWRTEAITGVEVVCSSRPAWAAILSQHWRYKHLDSAHRHTRYQILTLVNSRWLFAFKHHQQQRLFLLYIHITSALNSSSRLCWGKSETALYSSAWQTSTILRLHFQVIRPVGPHKSAAISNFWVAESLEVTLRPC